MDAAKVVQSVAQYVVVFQRTEAVSQFSARSEQFQDQLVHEEYPSIYSPRISALHVHDFSRNLD